MLILCIFLTFFLVWFMRISYLCNTNYRIKKSGGTYGSYQTSASFNGLAANTTSATGDITYLESATHTHTGASVKTTEDVIKTVEIE